jgi:protein-disulfide isomerase
LVGAVALLAVVAAVIGIAVVLSRGGSSSLPADVPRRGTLVNALPGAREVHRLFAGISQHGNLLGPPSAPVRLVEYVDLQCPYCREFEAQTLPGLVSRYVRTGKLRIEARPIAILGADSQRGTLAAIAAGRQGKLFNLAELLYFNQGSENTGWLNDAMIAAAAASIPGLDVPRLLSSRDSSVVSDESQAYAAQAGDDNVSKTPTIFVGKTGGPARQVTLASPTDVSAVATAINQALGR